MSLCPSAQCPGLAVVVVGHAFTTPEILLHPKSVPYGCSSRLSRITKSNLRLCTHQVRFWVQGMYAIPRMGSVNVSLPRLPHLR